MNNDRPGIIPLGPINQNLLDELRHIALAASVYDWEWGHSGTETQEAALAYMAEMLAHSDRTDLNLVVYGDDGGIPFGVAITGNGPTSEANARFICAAQPVNVIRLLDEIGAMREIIARVSLPQCDCGEDDPTLDHSLWETINPFGALTDGEMRIAQAVERGYRQDGAWWVAPDGSRTSVDGLPRATLPQCARCGEFEPFGTVHVCADVLSLLASPPGCCPCCGHPLPTTPPPPAANIAGESPPSGWRERPSQI